MTRSIDSRSNAGANTGAAAADPSSFVAQPRTLIDVRADAAQVLLGFFVPFLAGAAALAGVLCLVPVFYPDRLVVCLAVLLATLPPWWHRRRGRPLRGLAYLLSSLTLIFVLGTLANGGPRAPAFVALFVVISMSAWFVSARVLGIFVVGMLGLGLLSSSLLDAGILPTKPLPSGNWYASILVVIAGLIAFALSTVSRLLRQALETSQSTSDLMRSVFAAVDDTVILLDSNFRISSQSVSAAYAAREFDDSYFDDILNFRLDAAHGELTVRECLRQHLTAQQPQRIVIKQTASDNSTHHHEITAALLQSSHGASGGIVVVLRDVTHQETQRERWAHAQQMDAIGKLVSGVAHDFNNLLTGIQSSAEFMSEELDSSHDELLDIIIGSSERAALLTRRLLLHARKSSGDALKPISIDDLIKESIGLLQRSLNRQIEISTLLFSPSMFVNADPTLMQGIFLNLAINASQAMPDGGKLEFRSRQQHLDADTATAVHPSLYPGEYAIIEVADSGHGIPPEIQREIFEPFFTTKPAGKGTGLGLSTAMDVIRRSGGFITVTSTEGTGSTFTLYLPIVDEATTSEDFDPSEPRLVNSNGASIMVIDDEPAIRRSTSLSLTRLGYHVEAFRHGAEALSRMETEPPDVILLDMIMPGMSGRQVFEQVQLLEDPPPVILTTGYAESDDILFMLEQGLFAVIAKPYKAAKVAAEIERALTEHNSASLLAESMRDAISRPNDQAPSAPQRSSPRLHL